MRHLIHVPDLGPWRLVPGANDARIRSFAPPATQWGAVCHVVETPQTIIVVDPGLPEDMAAELHGLLLELVLDTPRPVSVFITHAHADICRAAGPLLADTTLRATVLCHGLAVTPLASGDAEVTLADDMHLALPHFPRLTGLFRGHGAIGVYRSLLTPHGELEALALPLTNATALQVYNAPGHTVDSICLRVKGALFTGDLLASLDDDTAARTAPGRVAQCPQTLATTAGKMLWIMDNSGVSDVFQSHGPTLTATEATRRLRTLMATQ
ncbi:glyoxylase-like metal-dependent hydrolase (beta-lactamase superfamily II) [Desulfobaculum xiamenense]|uniref:Glyoxylase-like metal-dependent hydrolase (Beta-lactamase superfamily II) n=1 Tax=Desulfobaculum xiamenense TaxID=995050 RepID=A0A846QQU1_9BACT|nr:MBL fold metallo-hydrolase [Desulfobaculum xiamenense]NJB67574.1 glyoxylase-like metal-dependent hydrolase (beta-lactamase superfamily II) [Desulfobaculum xiamenense]